MSFSIVFTPEAEDQLLELHRYIAAAGSVEVAARNAELIVAFCEELRVFPHRGRARDDIRPGLRIIGSNLEFSCGLAGRDEFGVGRL